TPGLTADGRSPPEVAPPQLSRNGLPWWRGYDWGRVPAPGALRGPARPPRCRRRLMAAPDPFQAEVAHLDDVIGTKVAALGDQGVAARDGGGGGGAGPLPPPAAGRSGAAIRPGSRTGLGHRQIRAARGCAAGCCRRRRSRGGPVRTAA